jgi:hypothetical protein
MNEAASLAPDRAWLRPSIALRSLRHNHKTLQSGCIKARRNFDVPAARPLRAKGNLLLLFLHGGHLFHKLHEDVSELLKEPFKLSDLVVGLNLDDRFEVSAHQTRSRMNDVQQAAEDEPVEQVEQQNNA